MWAKRGELGKIWGEGRIGVSMPNFWDSKINCEKAMFERKMAFLAGTQRNLEASRDSARASEAYQMTSTRTTDIDAARVIGDDFCKLGIVSQIRDMFADQENLSRILADSQQNFSRI